MTTIPATTFVWVCILLVISLIAHLLSLIRWAPVDTVNRYLTFLLTVSFFAPFVIAIIKDWF